MKTKHITNSQNAEIKLQGLEQQLLEYQEHIEELNINSQQSQESQIIQQLGHQL